MPGSLLFLGDFFGTLATARCLGRRGIDVVLADHRRVSRTAASRYVRRWVRSPDPADSDRFLDWLLSERSLHGRVLFPASDDQSYLFARHREVLQAHYRLIGPDHRGMTGILNKQLLYETCRGVGIGHPPTWYPETDEEVARLAAERDIDVLIKPKTQVQFASGKKGLEVPKGADLLAAFRRFRLSNTHGDELVEQHSDISIPMVQAFLDTAAVGIYSIAGFTDGSPRPALARAARKILQRPRRLGVGLCFESAPLRPDVLAHLGVLCDALGYVGIFEVEFIEHDGAFLLIDFNPRGYGQMAFEDARGLPLAYLYYLAAHGDTARLAQEWDRAEAWQPPGVQAFCHGGLLRLVRAAQLLTRVAGHQPEPWGAWRARHAAHLTDAVMCADDRAPAWVDAFDHVRGFVKHPRAFVRSLSR